MMPSDWHDRLSQALVSPAAWFGAVGLFRIILDHAYIHYVSRYVEDGFVLDVAWIRLLESWVALVLLAALMPRRPRMPSDFLLLMLFVLCMVSITSYYGLAGGERLWFWALVSQFVLFRLALIGFGRAVSIAIAWPRGGSQYAYLMAIAMLVLSAYRVIQTGSLDLLSFDLGEVYRFREIASSRLEVGVWAYLLSWAAKVCAIYMLVAGLSRAQWSLAILGGVSTILLFGVLAHKAILLAAMVAVVILLAWPIVSRGFVAILIMISIFLALLFQMMHLLETNLYQDIFSRRLFFVPARLDFIYYDFFVERDPLFFSNGFLKSIFQYPFDRPYPYVVGEFAGMGGEGTAANNGFLATGYMQLGWFGIIIYPLIGAFLAWLVDVLTRGKPVGFVAAVCFFPYAALYTSSDLPTAILTHGIGLLLVLLWLDGYEKNRK